LLEIDRETRHRAARVQRANYANNTFAVLAVQGDPHRGEEIMRSLLTIVLLLTSAAALAGTAFFKYERTTGMTKQCVYDYLGSEYTITLRCIDLCPLTIEVP
jgi:hypothetical protein